MPKLKTHKAASKKVKVTKNKKVLRRKSGQNHYNSKETGKKFFQLSQFITPKICLLEVGSSMGHMQLSCGQGKI